MVRKTNVKGGKNYKKGKKGHVAPTHKSIILKENTLEEYCKVTSALGSGRFNVILPNKETRMAILRGKMKKRKWVNVGDLILVSIREYQDDKVDILHCYSNDEFKQLKKRAEFPAIWKTDGMTGTSNESSGEDCVEFQEADVSKSKEQMNSVKMDMNTNHGKGGSKDEEACVEKLLELSSGDAPTDRNRYTYSVKADDEIDFDEI